uniref:histidine kinase n=1 Tax=Jahnella sp. MSr9139 TaxID=1434086 RepID=A0A4Y5T173_9BACT|nr:two-component hybrid sensor and regulator [Jahnella sp. MSr9139]
MDERQTPSRLAALNAVLQVAVRHPNLLLPRAFEELAEVIGRFVSFRIMSVMLPEAGGMVRLYAHSRGPTLPYLSFGVRIPATEPFLRVVFGEGQIFRRDDLREASDVGRAVAATGVASHITLPVRGVAPEPLIAEAAGAALDAAGLGEPARARSASGVVAALLFGFSEIGAAAAAPADLLQEIADVLGASFDRGVQLARQRRFAMILETAGDAMLAWDREGVVTDVNSAATRITGRGREALIGMPIRELLGPLPAPAAGEGAAQPQGRMTLAAIGKDGARVERVVSVTITEVADDALVAAHAHLRDLSEVVAAEREAAERLSRIRELEEQHRTLLDNVPLIIFRLEPATEELVYLNAHAERLLAVPVEEALRTPDFLRDAHADADGAACFEDAIARARLGAASPPYEARLRRRGGEAITVTGTVYPLVSERGEVVAIEGVFADVTAEHAQRTRLVQIDRLTTIGTLAAGVAHEINNPAAFILLGLGMIERILRGPSVRMEASAATSAANLLRELRESIQRITDITRDLRLFASSPAPEADSKVAIDVNRSVESATSLTRGQIIERAELEVRLAEVPPVLMDEGRLGQVIVNLLINAAQAIPKPSSRQGAREHAVTVETRSDGRTVEIEVRDTGAGISPEDLPRIWKPFFSTKGPEVGTGLGLSICREIIERAGGSIRVESPVHAGGEGEPSGSRFVIALPVAGRREPKTPVTSPVPRIVSRVRLLIVDDEAALARALADQLGRVHEVTVAPSADAALELLREGQRFEVVLCDLRMPGMSGDALYTAVAEIDPALARGFIFMTGVSFGADVERFLAESGRPLLEKPFSTEDALEAIAEVASRNRAERAAE